MARSKRMEQEEQELDLAPIMNMVVILIPLLLLSVVFVEVAVINITAPKLSMGPQSDTPPEDDKKPLNLTVTVAPNGLRIAAEGGQMSPVGACDPNGPTICLRKDKGIDVGAKFSQARELVNKGDLNKAGVSIEEGLSAFDWQTLYNELSKIKARYPEETVMNVSADPDVPFGAIVRLMDVARCQLEKESYDTEKAFWDAKCKTVDVRDEEDGKMKKKSADLFSDPVLAIAQ